MGIETMLAHSNLKIQIVDSPTFLGSIRFLIAQGCSQRWSAQRDRELLNLNGISAENHLLSVLGAYKRDWIDNIIAYDLKLASPPSSNQFNEYENDPLSFI